MIWFKHPNDLPNDKRLAALIDNEGCRGYGMYLRIIEMLCAQPDRKLSFSQLNIISRKGFSKKYMEKIIWEYKLFTIHEEEFESAINFNYTEKGNHLQNDLKTPEKTEDAKNDDKSLNNSGNTNKTSLARVREEQNREEQMKRKDDDVIQKNGGDGGITPYQSWRKQVDGLSKNQLFREMVCMRSGYSVLLNKHFDTALEEFKKHIVLLGKEEKMNSQEEVRSYFTFYTQAGQRTSQELHMLLQGLEKQQSAAAPPNPYRYEQLVNGRRTYLAAPSPTERCPDRTIPPSGTKRPVRGLRKPRRRHRKSRNRNPAETPHSGIRNATCQRSECHTSARPKCGIYPREVWHFNPRSVASEGVRPFMYNHLPDKRTKRQKKEDKYVLLSNKTNPI